MSLASPILTVAEYFAGIGLIRMGLEPCGWRVVFANDILEKKFEMYEAFFPDALEHYIVGDIFKIDPSDVRAATLATCSFPCVDLSLAGNMEGINGKHSSAFWGFTEILKAQEEHAPPIVMVENVPGWLNSNKGEDFRVTIQALNNLGYACDVFTLNAQSFTPQSRLRVFAVGVKFPGVSKSWDLRFERSKLLLSNRLKAAFTANADLDWFYFDIPKPPALLTEGLTDLVEKLDDADKRWWPAAEVQRHLNMMTDLHRQRVEALKQSDQVACRTFFRRMRQGVQRVEVRRDDIAGCLRTAVGGSAKQFLIQAGRGEIKMRTLTEREYALLQGVPERFPIKVSGVQALTGFGDAVCVPAIEWIARHVLNPLVEQYIPTEAPLELEACLTT